ncbi:hypothetical protein AXK11_05625 [Cephaloticoccus primus]|uniref:Uncharacterized protein n=1 Tax=Cephaloticoccus primus TaxID=1548207 RepID=A0A139SMW9_9BACT|nr:hypothetical protein AXK11_05625 [Cephaloticoccus primus]
MLPNLIARLGKRLLKWSQGGTVKRVTTLKRYLWRAILGPRSAFDVYVGQAWAELPDRAGFLKVISTNREGARG